MIEGFLPRQLNEVEISAAITAAIAEIEASSIRDMGRVMGALKAKYAGRMDFSKEGAVIKGLLG